MDALSVTVLAFLAGASTLLGGLVFRFLKVEKRFLNWTLSGSTGLLLSVIMLGMLPEAVNLGGVGYAALGLILGGVVFMVTGFLFPHTYLYEKYEDRLYSILKTGSLIITGILLYNIAAGLVIGAGFAGSYALGLAALIAVTLQNIPRGLAISIPMSQTAMERKKTLLILLLSGVPAMIGAAVTFAALSGSVAVLVSTGLSFCAGGMLFVFIDQMMPLIKGGRRMHELAITLFIGLFLGVLLLGI
jgi:ZIP family zinc transporter